MKVNVIICPKCKDSIFSRTRHDFRECSCKAISIDGGFYYRRIGWKIGTFENMKSKTINLKVTKQQLYDDWNKRIDKFGLILGKKLLVTNKRAINDFIKCVNSDYREHLKAKKKSIN